MSIRPAATVILIRERFEIFMVKRHGRSGFMAGAHVFPGGRVDDDDAGQVEVSGAIDGSFYAAAIRETAEECGVLLARRDDRYASAKEAASIFAGLGSGRSFWSLLDEHGLQPDAAALLPFSWWLTPKAEPRRYDTHFFLARAPAHDARPDMRETVAGDWFTPEAALLAYDKGEITLAPPTMVTLEDLRGFSSIDDVVVPKPKQIVPHMVQGDELILALPGDPLHEDSAPYFAGRTRVVFRDGRFVSESA